MQSPIDVPCQRRICLRSVLVDIYKCIVESVKRLLEGLSQLLVMRFSSTTLSIALLATALAHDAHQALLERDLAPPIAINDQSYTDCASAAWPPSNVGVELVPQAPSDEVAAMLDEISPANIEAIITKLVSFGTRHTLATFNSSTRGIHAARDWIASEMQGFAKQSEGKMTVEVQSYTQGIASRIPFPVVISNVVATIKGRETPEKVYVMTGHYDSRVTDVLNYEADSPGANDDASGVASESRYVFLAQNTLLM
jgi:hypothetical protein